MRNAWPVGPVKNYTPGNGLVSPSAVPTPPGARRGAKTETAKLGAIGAPQMRVHADCARSCEEVGSRGKSPTADSTTLDDRAPAVGCDPTKRVLIEQFGRSSRGVVAPERSPRAQQSAGSGWLPSAPVDRPPGDLSPAKPFRQPPRARMKPHPRRSGWSWTRFQIRGDTRPSGTSRKVQVDSLVRPGGCHFGQALGTRLPDNRRPRRSLSSRVQANPVRAEIGADSRGQTACSAGARSPLLTPVEV